MRWTNYHSHCDYCDGTHTPETYLKAAAAQGCAAYGFSSHAPLPFETAWAMKQNRLKDYVSEISGLRGLWAGKVHVHLSLEIDFIPGVTGLHHTVFNDVPFDYRIGSVHFVDVFPDGSHWEIDGDAATFALGVKEIFGGDVRAAVTRYFELVRRMVAEDTPDIVGHLDKIKMHNAGGKWFSESETWYRDQLLHTLHAIAESGAMVEVNTRGLYLGKTRETYPGAWALAHIRGMGIPIVLNSDAHRPEEVTAGFPQAAETLTRLGFSHLCVLGKRGWQEVLFSPKGLKLPDDF